MTREVMSLGRALQIFNCGSIIYPSGIKHEEKPFESLSYEEKLYVKECKNLFPFTDSELNLIEVVVSMAKAKYERPFSGIYGILGTFYASFSSSDDFTSKDSFSVLFGFYIDPTQNGKNFPEKVKFSTPHCASNSIPLRFLLPVRLFWNAIITASRLPYPCIKTPENSPLEISFYPEGNYQHVKPIGITLQEF